MKRPAPRRRGIILIMALVLMAVLTVILSVVTMQIISQRQVARQRQRHLQAEWLARAGIELAVARLLDSPSAFTDDKEELVPASKLTIAVEKTDKDVFSVSVEAVVGLDEGASVAHAAGRRFRRSESDGTVRLEAVK
jgi:Tfp pilus assembly protein PilX